MGSPNQSVFIVIILHVGWTYIFIGQLLVSYWSIVGGSQGPMS